MLKSMLLLNYMVYRYDQMCEPPDSPLGCTCYNKGLVKGNSPFECGCQCTVQPNLHTENTLERRKKDFG